MKGVANPGALESMPNVAAWLRHSHAAGRIVCEAYPADLDAETRNRVLALENVLILVEAYDEKLDLASRNLPFVSVLPVSAVDPRSLLSHDHVLATVAAVRMLEEKLS